jgi:hypothetical protein
MPKWGSRCANERKESLMGISGSLVLIAVGAILKWAVTATVSGVSLDTVGVILMVVGVVGLVLSVIFWSSWGGFGASRTTTVVRDEPTLYR